MITGIARKHVGKSRLDAHTYQGKQSLTNPRIVCLKLFFTQDVTDFVIRISGVRATEVHRHIEIIHPSSKTCVEDWLIQSRVACIDNNVGFDFTDQSNNILFISGIELNCSEASRVIQNGNGSFGRFK